MITLDCKHLVELTDAEFKTLAFRVAILQGSQASSVQTTNAPPSVKRAASGEHGPNVSRYLANEWSDGKGGIMKLERFRLGDIARAQFAALETPLVTNEEIALACLQAGKPIGDYFTKGKAESAPVAATVPAFSMDELDDDDI